MVEVVNTCGTRGSRMVNVTIGCSGFGFDFDYLLNVIKIPVTDYSNQCYGITKSGDSG